jgi:hypothetical protein
MRLAMKRLSFFQLPLIAQSMTMASIFMAWVMVEEFEIDRHHLDRFLPYYRVGNLCVYDLTVGIFIVVLWVSLRRGQDLSKTAR